MAYRFEVSTLAGVSLGAIDRFASAVPRTVSFGLSRPTTCAFGVRLDDELVDVLQRDPCRIRVYDTARTPSLVGHLDLIDDEEVAGEGGLGTVQFNCSDQWWLLAHRYFGGTREGYSQGTALAPVERGLIAKTILDTVNATSETGIRSNASVVPAGATYVTGWTFKTVAEAISELASTIDGFEWVIEPLEYTAGKVGDFKTYGTLGTFQEHAAFEYGDGLHNVKSYQSPRTRQTQANVAYHLPPGWPDNTGDEIVGTSDVPSILAWLQVEDVVPSDLAPLELRQQLVAEHVRVRALPRKLWSFDPILQTSGTHTVPVFGVDYDIGDLVPLRIKVRVGSDLVTRFDGVVRVFQVNVSIDAEGNVTSQTVVAGAD